MIEVHAEEIDALLALLRNGVSGGMDWGELQELIDDSARDGDELASMVHSLDLAHGRVTLALTEVSRCSHRTPRSHAHAPRE